MKVIMTTKNGNEKFVCESIDEFHGLLFVSLMNGNYSSKVNKVRYKLVSSDYIMNEETDHQQLSIFSEESLT